jgi:formate hydrogenlyase subunit 6/NADH:ubiquinone oxidoreductase subunit I
VEHLLQGKQPADYVIALTDVYTGAISESDGRKKVPFYDYITCIRCCCCLEICPEAAIKKEQGWLQWVLVF